MAKQINFTFKGVDYTLEFTRKSIETMEKQGFILSQVTEKPISTLPALFSGAFIAHHKFAKKEVIDEIFSNMTNREELFTTLISMYNEPITSIMDEPPVGNEGNIDWATN